MPIRAKVEGAWFIDDVTRMDDQQHALSALLLTVPILEAVPFDTGHPAPAAWLWILVILGTINPVRAAFSMPRNGTVGRDRTSLGVARRAGRLGRCCSTVGLRPADWVIDLARHERTGDAVRGRQPVCLLSAGIDVGRRPTTDERRSARRSGGRRSCRSLLPLFVASRDVASPGSVWSPTTVRVVVCASGWLVSVVGAGRD